jgi:hypothetical protein
MRDHSDIEHVTNNRFIVCSNLRARLGVVEPPMETSKRGSRSVQPAELLDELASCIQMIRKSMDPEYCRLQNVPTWKNLASVPSRPAGVPLAGTFQF